jgi:hypothetical protein
MNTFKRFRSYGFGFIHHHRLVRERRNRMAGSCFVVLKIQSTKRSKEDGVPYHYWRDAGFLISTPGNVVDDIVLKT